MKVSANVNNKEGTVLPVKVKVGTQGKPDYVVKVPDLKIQKKVTT